MGFRVRAGRQAAGGRPSGPAEQFGGRNICVLAVLGGGFGDRGILVVSMVPSVLTRGLSTRGVSRPEITQRGQAEDKIIRYLLGVGVWEIPQCQISMARLRCRPSSSPIGSSLNYSRVKYYAHLTRVDLKSDAKGPTLARLALQGRFFPEPNSAQTGEKVHYAAHAAGEVDRADNATHTPSFLEATYSHLNRRGIPRALVYQFASDPENKQEYYYATRVRHVRERAAERVAAGRPEALIYKYVATMCKECNLPRTKLNTFLKELGKQGYCYICKLVLASIFPTNNHERMLEAHAHFRHQPTVELTPKVGTSTSRQQPTLNFGTKSQFSALH